MKDFLRKNSWAILIFGVAFAIRLVYLLQIKSNPFFYTPMVDELWNILWAKEIIETSFWGKEVFFRGPLYPYFLAFILKITGSDYFWARLFQALIASGSVVLTYLLAKEFFKEKVARLASVFHAIYGTLIFYESMFLIPVIFIFLNLLGFLLFIRNKDNPRKWVFFNIGIVFGMAAIARPNVLVVIPLLVLWLFFNLKCKIELRSILVVILLLFVGIGTIVLPVTMRNYIVADDAVLISSQGGINLYLGNNSHAEGLTMRMPEITLDSKIPWNEFNPTISRYAEDKTGHKLKPSEVSSFWSNKAKQFIFENPSQFIALTFKKLVYFCSGFENSDQQDIYDFRKYSSTLSILIFNYGLKFPFGLFMPLALAGFWFGIKRRKELAPLYIFMLGYIPTVILFLVTARHRLTIIPLLLIFAAYAVFKLYDRLKKPSGKQVLIPIVILLTGLFVLNMNFFDLGFQNKAQIHHNLAINYNRQGQYSKAIEEYKLAIKESPGVSTLYFGLGTAYFNSGQYQEAERQLNHAVALDPEYTDALMNLGNTYSLLDDHNRAARLFQRVITLEPNRAEAYANLGDEYIQLQKFEEASKMYSKAIDLRPDDYIVITKMGVLFGQAGDTATSSLYFLEALALDSTYLAAYLNWGNIYLQNGDTAQAIIKYNSAILLDSTAIEPYYNLAVLYTKQGERGKALENIYKLLKINPDYPPALSLQKRLRG
ncbi:MAG: tetratricopeptide repeat protein [candidate division Zixibacteria bacterium]|nr:tetratricopeptide repeat protein [candidate division Zixibacteria bacterium]